MGTMLRAFPEMTSLVHSLVEFLARQSKPSQRTMIGGNVRATLYRESSFTACNRHIWDMVSPVKSPRQVATGIFVTLRHCIVDLPVLSSIVGVTTKSDGRLRCATGMAVASSPITLFKYTTLRKTNESYGQTY